MWSTARSEAALEAALPVPIEIRPLAERAPAAAALRRGERHAEADLSMREPAGARRSPGRSTSATGSRRSSRGPSRPSRSRPDAIIPARGRRRADRLGSELRRARRCSSTASCAAAGPSAGLPGAIEAVPEAPRARRRCRARSPNSPQRPASRRASVSVGDAGSRWGSCSSQGRIRLSWRLILAPPAVRRYVVAHEVAHLVHLDHGAEVQGARSAALRPGPRRGEGVATPHRAAAATGRPAALSLAAAAARLRRRRGGWRAAAADGCCCGGKAWSSSCCVGSPVPSGLTIGCCCGSPGSGWRRIAERHSVLVDHRLHAVRVDRLVAVHLLFRRQLPVGHRHLRLELLDRPVGDRDAHEVVEGARRRGAALQPGDRLAHRRGPSTRRW